MTEFVGTGALVRFIVRRDRVRIAVWIAAILVLVLTSAQGIERIYPTDADLVEAAAAVDGNAAAIAFNGPVQGLETLGGRIAFETGTFGMIVAGLMSLLMIGRHTRAEEESGRIELVRATVVGRHAPTTAALLVVGAMNLIVAAGIWLLLVSLELSSSGSLVFAVGFLAVGLVFATVAMVSAQVSENTRVASGIAGIGLGAAFVLRAIGDIRDGTLSWFSPIGWAQKMQPFAGDRWWPVTVPVIVSAMLGVVAAALAIHRDVGGGLIPPRPGPSSASPRLRSPLALAFRLQRGSVIGWTASLFVLGAVYGSVANDIEDFVGDNEALADILARAGGDLTESFLATSLLILALVGSGFSLQAALRLRAEETGIRAEPVLATPVSRSQWVASYLAVAAAGTVAVLAGGGLGLGITYGIASDDLGQVPRMVVASLTYVPAVAVLVGIVVVLFGVAPGAVTAAWAGLGAVLAIGMLGELLNLPGWVTGLSPFEQTPKVPADDVAVAPLLVLAAIAMAFIVTGFVGFRRRDLAS
jgi:ABC-2 type transport system permease protein